MKKNKTSGSANGVKPTTSRGTENPPLSVTPVDGTQPYDSSASWVAERAFELWARAGRPDGKAEEHWYQAERELGANRGVDAPVSE